MKLNNKPTVSVGIPAFNEEANIGKLINSILAQETNNFNFEKIVIRTDGCTDKTNEVVKSIKDKRIHLIVGTERLGKALGMNIISQECDGDLMIALDADTLIGSTDTFDKLVNEFKYKNLDIAGIKIKPVEAQTEYESILINSIDIKSQVFEDFNEGDNWYTCCGVARMMNKKFYKDIKFIEMVGEDLFSFMYAKKHNFKYGFLKSAFVRYKLSENIYDHRKQNARFNSACNQLKDYFGVEFFEENFQIPKGRFISVLARNIIRAPKNTISYILITFGFTLKDKLLPQNISARWSMAKSTRILA